MKAHNLTNEQAYFCELYVHGDAPFAGNKSKCYQEAFNVHDKKCGLVASRLLRNPDVDAYIQDLKNLKREDDLSEMKTFLTRSLMHIVEECSIQEYMDRRGTKLSPAPLRSVAVSAAKALMDMYPLKEAEKHQLSIDGGGNGGITFNVIVPKPNDNQEETIK